MAPLCQFDKRTDGEIMWGNSSLSLRAYAFKVVTPIAGLMLLVVALSENYLMDLMAKRSLATQIEENCRFEANILNWRIKGISDFADSLATNDLIINGLVDIAGRGSYLPAFIRSLKLPVHGDAKIYIVNFKGNVVLSSSSEEDSLEQRFEVPMKSGVILSTSTLKVVSPIIRWGQPEGAIIVQYPATSFKDLFAIVGLEESLVVTTKDNKVAYSSNPTMELSPNRTFITGSSEWVQVKRQIGFSGAILICMAHVDSASEILGDTLWIEIFGLLAALVFFIILISLSITSIVRPLTRVAEQIAAVSDIGSLDNEIDTSGPHEISQIARTYNTMAKKLKDSHFQKDKLAQSLRKAQKLEAVGQLAGGIAHEINTPLQYIGDNVRFVKDASHDLISLIHLYESLKQKVSNQDGLAAMASEIDSFRHDIDDIYLQEEVPEAINQTLSGIQQVVEIVSAMKEFSHPGKKTPTLHNLNASLENTIAVSRNEWKHIAEIRTDFDQNLPAVMCNIAEMNQVFLNVLVNAAHAIASVKDRSGLGTITVSTGVEDKFAIVRIQDTGTGIPEGVQDQVFNPFFTTKEVGVGTGQGLAIAYDIVVHRHRGLLTFETVQGEGTTFIIRLPVGSPD